MTSPSPQPSLARATLLDAMPQGQFDAVVRVTRSLLDRRFDSMQNLRDVAATGVNLNPFLMLAMAPAYNIFSPYEAAEYAQNAKLPHGDATAFGKFVEDAIFPIFGAGWPAEKYHAKRAPHGSAYESTRYSSIDGDITVDAIRYLITYKSGPWTMNQSHAHEMIANFPLVHQQTGCDIIIAITYGTPSRLNNKPALVRTRTGPYVHTLVGRDLWEFMTGVKDAHMTIFEAIKEAQREFATAHGGKTFYEHLISARLELSESFRKAFDLNGAGDDMWEQIFRGSF